MMLTSPRTEGSGQRQDELELRSVLNLFFFFQALESTTRFLFCADTIMGNPSYFSPASFAIFRTVTCLLAVMSLCLAAAPAAEPAPAPWGLAVRWALGALVDESVPEYILWPEHVADAARAAGLRVVETDNFHAFAYRHGVPQDGLSENEWAVSRLYRTLVAAR